MNKKIMVLFALFMLISPMAFAADGDLDKIMEPVTKATDALRFLAGGIALLVLIGAGIFYIVSGNNPQAQDTAKKAATGAVLGLALIAVAPFVVSYFNTPIL